MNLLRVTALPSVALISIALGGCATESSSPTPDAPGASQPAGSTPVVLELDGEEIAGVLDGSATAASLISQLPVTLTVSDYGGQELIGELPEPLSLEGAPDGSGAAPLTIGYYVPQQSLVLYYTEVGYFGGIVPIGSFESTDAIVGRPGHITLIIRAR